MGACDIGEQAVYNALVVMNQREREAASFPLSTPHTHLPDAAALAPLQPWTPTDLSFAFFFLWRMQFCVMFGQQKSSKLVDKCIMKQPPLTRAPTHEALSFLR